MLKSQSVITKGVILNVSSNTDVYERGERYYRDGKLLSYNALEGSDGITTVSASVEGNYKNYDVSLKLDGAGALSGYSCSCESHSIWRGACKHVVAVLFAQSEGYSHMFSAEKMNRYAQNLNDSLEKIIFEGIDKELPVQEITLQNLLRLLPALNYTPKGIGAAFTVGYEKMYPVKNISAFITQ